MKICYIITRGDSIGGAQIHVRDFSRAMKERGHGVHVLVGSSGAFTDDLDASGIAWTQINNLARSINPLKDGALISEVKKALREIAPDIVSSHGSKAGFAARLAARSLGIKNVFTAHGWAFTDGVPALPRLIYTWVEGYLAKKSSRIITVSQNDFDLAVQSRVSQSPHMIRIHNGLPFMSSIDRSPAQGTFRWISVARFQDQKDHATLFEALARLGDRDWVCELIGDGPMEDAFKLRAKELGLEDRIRFLGQRKDVAERLAQADGFLLISHWEGFPRSIIEAMRASLPVLASDVGGSRESVNHGKTGFLIPRKDAGFLAEKMSWAMDHPQEAWALGQEARRVYEAEFTFERMFERTFAVYEEILRSDR